MNLRLVKTRPLSDLSRNSCVTRPKVPNRLIRACSNALAAVVALPDRDRCQPNSSRVWQSMSEEDQKTIRGDRFPDDWPAFELKATLHGILVETGQPGHRPVAKGRFLLDHDPDRLSEARINLRNRLGWPVTDGPARPLNQVQSLVSGTLIPSARRP